MIKKSWAQFWHNKENNETQNKMEDKYGMVDDFGTSDGTVQCTNDCLGQNSGGAGREHEMEHGSINDAPAEEGNGNSGGLLQGSGKEDAKHAIGRKKLDANDQKIWINYMGHVMRGSSGPMTLAATLWLNLDVRRKLREEGRQVAQARGRIRWWDAELERSRGALGIRGGNEGRGKQPKRVAGAGREIRIPGPGATARTAMNDEAGGSTRAPTHGG